ncbi:hypothetical protein ACWGDT_37335 [Streptomyces avermitilis]
MSQPRRAVGHGARISGRLDLAGVPIGHPLWFEDCWFEEGVDLFGTVLAWR